MCRLLMIRANRAFPTADYLKAFALLAKNSMEYQGHGWGLAYRANNQWKLYKNIQPIWEDNLTIFPSTTFLVVHARSAFRDEGIVVENNMPFIYDDLVFIFNGELHGVRITSPGRIGAEKIFNYILRFAHGNVLTALQQSIPIITKRTRYVKAMNILISDAQQIYAATQFQERPAYFTLYHKKIKDMAFVCSDPFPGEKDWRPIAHGTIAAY